MTSLYIFVACFPASFEFTLNIKPPNFDRATVRREQRIHPLPGTVNIADNRDDDDDDDNKFTSTTNNNDGKARTVIAVCGDAAQTTATTLNGAAIPDVIAGKQNTSSANTTLELSTNPSQRGADDKSRVVVSSYEYTNTAFEG